MVEKINTASFDEELKIKEINRTGGQLILCEISSCEWNRDMECYCSCPHVGYVRGFPVPVCLDFIGGYLE